jgi:signal transduction histidine kinase
MENIYIWILFVVICIITIIPAFIFFVAFFNDDDDEAGNFSYLIPFSALLMGLFPLVGSLVINVEVLSRAYWIAELVILSLLFIIFIFHVKRNPHYLLSLLLTIGIDTIVFFSHSSIMIKQDLPYYGNFSFELPESLYSIWLPVLIISSIFAFILKRKETNYIHVPKNAEMNKETKKNDSFSEILVRKSIENLTEKFSMQNEYMMSRMEVLFNQINRINITSMSVGDKKNNEKIYRPMLEQLQSLSSKVDMLLNMQDDQKDVIANNASNIMMIKEITHFIATPLANIESNCNLLLDTYNSKLKKYEQNTVWINRILTAVSMCKGILETYREIYLSTKSDETYSLKEIVNDSFNIYMERDKKKLKLNTNIKDSYLSCSNYFMMSLIMPLLSNAVTASRESSTIELIESNGIIRISNTCQSDVDITLFETDGYSSKPNHYGLGLYTVRHLLASRKMGKMKCRKENNRIIFEIPIKQQ